MKDINNKELKNGDIINIHQTVNGENLFIILNCLEDKLDIRYGFDIDRKYEYDKNDLLTPSLISGLLECEIIANINDIIKTYR